MPSVTPKEGLTDTAVTSQQKFTLAWQEAAAAWDWEGKSERCWKRGLARFASLVNQTFLIFFFKLHKNKFEFDVLPTPHFSSDKVSTIRDTVL